MTATSALIAAERNRQISIIGYTPERDDQCVMGELQKAAACYAAFASGGHYLGGKDIWVKVGATWRRTPENRSGRAVPAFWPWSPEAWKPGTDPVRMLVKAGALMCAEGDRIARALEREGRT